MAVSTPDEVTETAKSMGGGPLPSVESNGTVKIANFASRALATASGKEGAQQWIANWRRKNAAKSEKGSENGTMKVSTTDNVFTDDAGSWPPKPAASAATAEDIPSNVADARKWISTWRESAGKPKMAMK